jgi:hypothetical protein
MSTGKLKAQYNRVRTSTALQSNSIWSNTIGIEHEQGTNAAIEATLPAPMRGGPGRAAKRQAAQDLMAATGYQPSVTSYEGLIALAKASGQGVDTGARGACKICGGLGHLTKQCKNMVGRPADPAAGDGAAAAHQLLGADVDDLSDLSSLSSSSSDSDSSTSSDSSGDRKRKRKSRDKDKKRKKDKHSRHKSSSDRHKTSSDKSKKRSKSSSSKKSKHKSKDHKRKKARHSDSD